MGALGKVADFAQKSITFTCIAASVYILVFTGRNYLATREKRLANAAAMEREKQMDGTSPSSTEVKQSKAEVLTIQLLSTRIKFSAVN